MCRIMYHTYYQPVSCSLFYKSTLKKNINICHLFSYLLAMWDVSEVECIVLDLLGLQPWKDVYPIEGEVNDKHLIFQKDMLRNWGSFQHFGPVCTSFLWSSLFYRNDKCIFSLWRILSASGMKLPRAAWGLVFHWSFNNKSLGFVNKGLQTSAEFYEKPVEGAEGLEDLGRSAGVCVFK